MGVTPKRPDQRLAERGGVVELLRLPALAYGLVNAVRGRLYDWGLLPIHRLEVPVVCVGNLTAGGTGKTPMVAWVARRLIALGRRPGLLSRGYGAGPSGENDEARELAQELPSVPHIQDPDRVAGGRRLVEQGVDVVVLDDGFQHRRLHRDLDLVLMDCTRPWGLPRPAAGGDPVRALLPRGLLRESPRGLARAHAVVLTRSDQVPTDTVDALTTEVRRLAPGMGIAVARHAPRGLRRRRGPLAVEVDPAELQGREVDLLSGIGNPAAFEATVAGLGARIAGHRSFPDHHAFVASDLEGLGGERWVLTTQKDEARLPAGSPDVHVLDVELELDAGAGVLDALLGALPPGRGERERRSLHEGLHG